MFYFHPYLGKISILTNVFQRGWNHKLDNHGSEDNDPRFSMSRFALGSLDHVGEKIALPETNGLPFENRPCQKDISSSNHPLLGAMLVMLVSGRVEYGRIVKVHSSLAGNACKSRLGHIGKVNVISEATFFSK